jgi:hypothetical protein
MAIYKVKQLLGLPNEGLVIETLNFCYFSKGS